MQNSVLNKKSKIKIPKSENEIKMGITGYKRGAWETVVL
jgi:hypothetical protein